MSLTIDLGDTFTEGQAVLRLPRMTTEEFWDFCQRNPDLKVERNPIGDLIIMAPTGGQTGNRNSVLSRYLDEWAEKEGTGLAFDSSTLFQFPDGAERSPDASWITQVRWEALTNEERERPSPICPDFVIELLSPSDRLNLVQAKMEEYIANGVRLGWLIDRRSRRVYVYRPDRPVEELDNPAELSGEPELPDFVMPMRRIF